MTKETTYFKIISHFGGKKDDYSNVIMVIESSNDLKQWRKIYSSSNLDETITWLASIILVNKLQDSYFVIADFMICHQIVTKVYYETQKQENHFHKKNSTPCRTPSSEIAQWRHLRHFDLCDTHRDFSPIQRQGAR